MPYAGAGYRVFRNVKDYGAIGDGKTDDWFVFAAFDDLYMLTGSRAAIQRAITDGGRCGGGCSSTSTKGAIVYFPEGAYAISKPILQYYFTVFIGASPSRPIIKPLDQFEGIALIDTNFYVENGNGENWYVYVVDEKSSMPKHRLNNLFQVGKSKQLLPPNPQFCS
jgi:hypothetical protein